MYQKTCLQPAPPPPLPIRIPRCVQKNTRGKKCNAPTRDNRAPFVDVKYYLNLLYSRESIVRLCVYYYFRTEDGRQRD